jgi:hypothetical protein
MTRVPAAPPRFWFELDSLHLWIGSDAAGTEQIIEECLTAATKRAVKERQVNLAKKSEAKAYEAKRPEHIQVAGALAFKDPVNLDTQEQIRSRLIEYMDTHGLRLQSE